jgi:ABC-type multidrug transport system fused ATPase/permease subunit
MKFANLCVKLSIFAITGYLAKSGQITLGVLTIIVSFFGIISNKLEEISRSYIDGQSRLAYIQHIDNYLNTPTENWYGNNELLIKNAKIEFKNVCFSYNDQQRVFENLSFAINPGEKVALVGKNGCGKTTLADLLIGFSPIESGEILIDTQNINSVTLKSIRQNIGVVSQEVLIFEGSIKHNLLLGNPNSSDAEINTACQQAGILDFIKSLPQGFDTVIGKNGIDLSLGQKQRLSIARTYLKNPPIIIFDEATSALDAKTELDIHKAWENTLSGRTAIIISHRISSIMMSDRVIVLENGKIVYTGPPSDALSKSAYFDWIGEKNNYDSKNQISN